MDKSPARGRRDDGTHGNYHQPAHIRLLGPALWSITACSTIYLGCAAYDVYQASLRAKAKSSRWPSEQNPLLEEEKANAMWRNMKSERPEFADNVDPLRLSTMALTAGIYVATSAMPSTMPLFLHTPLLSPNYTLLTSIFGHSGPLHLGANLYAMFHLIPRAAQTETFRGNSAHLAAFYLSAGILSSLAQHATAAWPRRRLSASSLGASGALFALLGVVGSSFPDMQVGIILLPGSMPVTQAMMCMALFDAVGIFVRYRYFELAHAAHLSGLALGVAYATYGGNEKLWRPGRKLAFKAMRYAGLL
ncbi:hypothetical protein F5Y14DRAFT_459935 [Nemania sp. NC0429]|nr:hypothetical protein F5Y14DRAFT_459935 [Nemania sp. NC0429]